MTPDDLIAYAKNRREQWDGQGLTSPKDGLCPQCGAYVEGSRENLQKHIEWHAMQSLHNIL